MRSLAAPVLAGAFFMPALGLAAPQIPCGERETVLSKMKADHGEVPVARGIAASGKAMFEVLATPDGSTWTLIVTGTDGTSCLAGSGGDWQTLRRQPQGAPA